MYRHSAADFRAEIARQRSPIYKLAAAVDVYPGRLGQMLNERIPMPDQVAERLSDVLGGEVGSDTLRREQEGK